MHAPLETPHQEGSYWTTRFLPRRLAWYMAASACRSVSVGDTSEPWTATPALNVVDASTFVHAAAMRSAIARAVGPAPGRTTRYSSPPKLTLALYGAEGAADNLTRITVDGSSNNTDWLKVQVHRSGPEVMTWEAGPLQLTIGCTSGRTPAWASRLGRLCPRDELWACRGRDAQELNGRGLSARPVLAGRQPYLRW